MLTDSCVTVCQAVNTKEEKALPDARSPVSADASRPHTKKENVITLCTSVRDQFVGRIFGSHREDSYSISREGS